MGGDVRIHYQSLIYTQLFGKIPCHPWNDVRGNQFWWNEKHARPENLMISFLLVTCSAESHGTVRRSAGEIRYYGECHSVRMAEEMLKIRYPDIHATLTLHNGNNVSQVLKLGMFTAHAK